jgi:alpha-tubulin suppressor-like RCC1 family protein
MHAVRMWMAVAAIATLAGCQWVFSPDVGDDGGPPPDAPLPVGQWARLSSGVGDHACAIAVDETLWCWGAGASGAIGDGERRDRPVRVQPAPTTRWQAVATGFDRTCAIDTDGGLWCWGEGGSGALGDGTTDDHLAPVRVAGPGTWAQVALGAEHTCGVQTDGSLWCWGENARGQLGVGLGADALVPGRVDSRGYSQVSAGAVHTCAVGTDATLWCWGGGTAGQVGDGTSADVAQPVQIRESAAWSMVAAGAEHTCGIMNGGVACWGANGNGQLGTGATALEPVPTVIDSGATRSWLAIAAGERHTCGLRTGGMLACWGDDHYGAIAQGGDAGTDALVPTVVAPDQVWTAIGVGRRHTCAIDDSGATWCAGANGLGQLGDGVGGPRRAPVRILDTAAVVAASATFACASDNVLTRWCWGDAEGGQLADDNTTSVASPRAAVFATSSFGLGVGHGCGVVNTMVFCAGRNGRGQLGDGTTASRTTPMPVPGTFVEVTSNAAASHVCARPSGAFGIFCWGANDRGQIGDSSGTDALVPTSVSDGVVTTSIAVGGLHTCAVNAAGVLRCWGANHRGQLGLGDVADRSSPNQVAARLAGWQLVAAGAVHTCAIRDAENRMLYCWGRNDRGQLGTSAGADALSPAVVPGGLAWQTVSAGGAHTCAIAADQRLWCWGAGDRGALGTGSFADAMAPTTIGDAHWRSVAAGAEHTCGIQVDNSVWCWGDNAEGQVGDGTAWRTALSMIN